MRALLFYQEQKHKRVKKIKSKMFRKLRKKQRDKHAAEVREHIRVADPELAKELDEKDLRKRAQERFSLRHKNMSKWAKNALKHGQVHAPGTKEAIQESLRLGQELKRKMDTMNSGSSSSEEESGSEEEIEYRNDGGATSKAKKLLSQIEDDQGDSLLSSKKGIMSLKFMQNAVARQRENARSEALGLLEELGGPTSDTAAASLGSKKNGRKSLGNQESIDSAKTSSGSGSSSGGSLQSTKVQFSGGTKTKMGQGMENDTRSDIRLSKQDLQDEQNELLAVSKKKMKAMVSSWGEGGDVPSWNEEDGGEYDNKTTSSSNGSFKTKEESDHYSSSEEEGDREEEEEEEEDILNVDSLSYREVQAELKKRGKKVKGKKVQLVKTLKSIVEVEQLAKTKHKAGKKITQPPTRKKNKKQVLLKETEETEESNPWLAKKNGSSSSSKTSNKRKRNHKQEETLNVEDALSAINSTAQKKQKKQKATETKDATHSQTPTTKATKQKTQSELVQMAFAVDEDVEAAFAREKNQLTGEELNGGKKKEPVLMGWGSWTGAGAKVPRKKKQIKKAKKNTSTTGGRQDKHLKYVIISEKRNKRAAKYLVPTLPHQYENKQQYERSLRNPIGPEWNTSDAHAKMTRPKVIAKSGNVIAPIKMSKQYKRKLVSINAEFSALQKKKRAKRNNARRGKL